MVEFALVLPLLLLLIFGIFDFGRAINYWIDATHMANEAARYAAVGNTPTGCSSIASCVKAQADSPELKNGGTNAVPNPVQVCVAQPSAHDRGNARSPPRRRSPTTGCRSWGSRSPRPPCRPATRCGSRTGTDPWSGARREIMHANSESGGVLVLVAVTLPVIIMLASFVIDVGNWYEHKRHLQLQVDSAALAGGGLYAAMPCSNTNISAEARKYAGPAATGGGTYNAQVGNTPTANLHVLINSTNYYNQGGSDNSAGTPCSTGFVDVKATETDAPWFLKVANLVGLGESHHQRPRPRQPQDRDHRRRLPADRAARQ